MSDLKSSQYTDQGTTRLPRNYRFGEIRNVDLSGNAQHTEQAIGDFLDSQFKVNQTLTGSPANWDTGNRLFPFATLATNSSVTVNLSNVLDSASGTLLVTKQTTSDITITFGGTGLTHSPTSFLLVNSNINTIFRITWEANGTAIKWALSSDSILSLATNGIGATTSDPSKFGLGGNPLIENTTIDGDSNYSLSFENLTSFNIDASEDSSAILRIESTTKGSKFAGTMDTTERDAISTPLGGITVYNSDNNRYEYYNGTSWASFSETPTLTDTYIGFGNGSNKLTGSSNLTWDDSNRILSIIDANDGLLVGNNIPALLGIGNTYLGGNFAGTGLGNSNIIIGSGNSFGSTIGSGVDGVFVVDGTTNQDNTIAIKGTVSATRSIAIGYLSTATASEAIALGESADALGSRATALGYNSYVGGNSSTAIGGVCTILAANCVGVGESAVVNNSGGIAIGKSANVSDNNSIAIGYLSKSRDANEFGIGSTTAPITVVRLGQGGTSTATVGDVTIEPTQTGLLNDNGANLILEGGEKDGTGIRGSVILQQKGGTANLESNETGLGFFATAPIAQYNVDNTATDGTIATLENIVNSIRTGLINYGLMV
jgi:hypothetical protein